MMWETEAAAGVKSRHREKYTEEDRVRHKKAQRGRQKTGEESGKLVGIMCMEILM